MKHVLILLTFGSALALTANAHPTGHQGTTTEVTQHVFSQPDHLVVISLSIAALVLLSRKLLSKAQ